MIGETPVRISGADVDSSEMLIECASGRVFRFWHGQDCCENVRILDVIGDIDDLLNTEILMAECVSGDNAEYDASVPPVDLALDDSHTWTFYKFASKRGYVTFRWLGESNGYYSETVEFEESLEEGSN